MHIRETTAELSYPAVRLRGVRFVVPLGPGSDTLFDAKPPGD